MDDGTQPFAPTAFPAGVPHDNFTTVWTGQFQAPYTGSYVFGAITDDGVRLTVNGVTATATPQLSGPDADGRWRRRTLTAGREVPDVKIEYFQSGGGSNAQFVYSYCRFAQRDCVPQSQLFSGVHGSARLRRPTSRRLRA